MTEITRERMREILWREVNHNVVSLKVPVYSLADAISDALGLPKYVTVEPMEPGTHISAASPLTGGGVRTELWRVPWLTARPWQNSIGRYSWDDLVDVEVME
jgi:hypothetical protein